MTEVRLHKVTIINKIIELRDVKVMLDRDLAELYGVTTKRLNEQVKRNLKRFPNDFMFQITEAEKEELIEKHDYLESLKFSHSLPYVFTEHGTVMLASVLNSERAVEVNILVVRVFTELRKYLSGNTEIKLEVEKIKKAVCEQGEDIQVILHHLDKLLGKPEKPREQIGYKTA
jgi:hypothetical protein